MQYCSDSTEVITDILNSWVVIGYILIIYIEHWSNTKNREQQLEIYLIQCSEIKG